VAPAPLPLGRARHPGAAAALQRLFWGLAFFIAALLVLHLHIAVFPVRYFLGQVVPYDLVSPVETTYVDSTELAKLSSGGKASIIDPRVGEGALLRLDEFFSDLRASRLSGEDVAAQIEQLASKYPASTDLIALLLTYSDEDLAEIEGSSGKSLNDYMLTAISAGEIAELRRQASENPSLPLPERLAIHFLRENIIEAPDVPAVQKYVMKMVTHILRKGEIILSAGGVVTQTTLDKLEAVESGMHAQRLYKFYGLGILLLVVMFVWYVHLRFYKRKIFANPTLWGQLGLICLVALAISLVVGRLPFRHVHYAIPLATAAAVIIIVTMYDAILAFYVGLGLAVLAALALNYNSNLFLYILVSTTFPVVFLNQRSTARQLALFGLNLGGFNVGLALVVFLVSVEAFSWWALLYGFLAGVASAVLALGVTPLLEMFSTQLTPGKLQALLNPELPLLKRLLEEAPGTYFHSVVMASMCEEACSEIGANGLLAKVGCMYHDIGKLKRPGFYAENIGSPERNPHRHLPPESSFNIIVQHIQDGIEMGRRAGLPPEVLAFIPEHHGTTVMKYFLEEARKKAELEGGTPSPEHFRYSGPDPRSKETGVAMLADACEAMIRAMDEFTEAEAEQAVRETIEERVRCGHLDGSGLTVGDLNHVASAFIRVLVNLHHSRLKYPEQLKEEMQTAGSQRA